MDKDECKTGWRGSTIRVGVCIVQTVAVGLNEGHCEDMRKYTQEGEVGNPKRIYLIRTSLPITYRTSYFSRRNFVHSSLSTARIRCSTRPSDRSRSPCQAFLYS